MRKGKKRIMREEDKEEQKDKSTAEKKESKE